MRGASVTVGITAGASCPNNLIEDTIRRLGAAHTKLAEGQDLAAVVDALKPFGVSHVDMPVTPLSSTPTTM